MKVLDPSFRLKALDTGSGADATKLPVKALNTPGLVPARLRTLPQGSGRRPHQQTSGVHVQMKAMMGQVSSFADRAAQTVQAGLLDIEHSLNQIADFLFNPMTTTALVPVGLGPAAIRPLDASSAVKGSNIVMMSTIREMLGFGGAKNKCPGEYLDREYADVVKEAKTGNKKARTAKKLAEQGDRLSQKFGKKKKK